MPEHAISTKNEAYWDELCGTSLAKALGISDSSAASLERFDRWYMDFYPYLADHIPYAQFGGKDILEIGLGYGTVAQRLAECGANYSGLDIAQGPVNMVNLRLKRLGLEQTAIRGSILEPPYQSNSFDAIVAIGCLHHTGDLQLAIERCRGLLKPGGKLIFMVYYSFSYRRWVAAPLRTMSRAIAELFGARGVVGPSEAAERAAYDANQDGEAAPHTDWVSKRSIRYLCRNFAKVDAGIENIDQEVPFRRIKRERLLRTSLPKRVGLDLYVSATK